MSKLEPIPAACIDNDSLKSAGLNQLRWIWEGVIIQEGITLLSAPEKTGKTTLLSLLLDRRREGGQLLGRPVHPGRTIVCSEEITALWAMRQPPLDFGSQLEFHRPLGGVPTRGGWRRFIDHLLDLGEDRFDLLVIDTAMAFLPALENTPRRMRQALEQLRVVTYGGTIGVLLLHQAAPPRERTRTRGILAACADILIDMRVPAGDPHTRRRDIDGFGRFPGMLGHVAAELNLEGTDYLLLSNDSEKILNPVLETLYQVLRQSNQPLTRQEILDRWPTPTPPAGNTLWRALTTGFDQGLLLRTGAGTKAEAFRYAVKADHSAAPEGASKIDVVVDFAFSSRRVAMP